MTDASADFADTLREARQSLVRLADLVATIEDGARRQGRTPPPSLAVLLGDCIAAQAGIVRALGGTPADWQRAVAAHSAALADLLAAIDRQQAFAGETP